MNDLGKCLINDEILFDLSILPFLLFFPRAGGILL